MTHEQWSMLVGIISIAVCTASAIGALGIAAWAAITAYRDERAAGVGLTPEENS